MVAQLEKLVSHGHLWDKYGHCTLQAGRAHAQVRHACRPELHSAPSVMCAYRYPSSASLTRMRVEVETRPPEPPGPLPACVKDTCCVIMPPPPRESSVRVRVSTMVPRPPQVMVFTSTLGEGIVITMRTADPSRPVSACSTPKTSRRSFSPISDMCLITTLVPAVDNDLFTKTRQSVRIRTCS